MPGLFIQDRQNIGLAAVKDNVVRLETLVALVIPFVRPELAHAVDVLIVANSSVR